MHAPEWRTKLAYSRRVPVIEEHHKRKLNEVLRELKDPLDSLVDPREATSLRSPVHAPSAQFFGGDGREVEVPEAGAEPEESTSCKTAKPCRSGRASLRECRATGGGHAAPFNTAGSSASSQSIGRNIAARMPAQPLAFSSSFECGNLLSAKLVQVSESSDGHGPLLEYELEMESDTQSSGRTQWFYFAVLNSIPCSAIFRIVNFRKGRSLYQVGMQPHVFSEHDSTQKNSLEWDAAACSDVSYVQNSRRTSLGKPLFTLSFRYEFRYQNDTVYFAGHTPYSFSMLREFVVKLGQDERTRSHVSVNTLCRSMAGIPVPLLLVTSGLHSVCAGSRAIDGTSAMRERLLGEVRRKPAVVLIARQHPGEVVASWVMAGFIRFIVGPSPEAVALRNRFCFHIVPMVNVDGVIHGNSRCTLAGADPNRCWAAPSPSLHPVVHALREYIVSMQRRGSVELFLDIHGHSQRTSAFFYGCCPEEVQSALFPKLTSLATRDVDFQQSRWRFAKAHDQTARAVAHKECGIKYSYTLETSFFGQSSTDAVLDSKQLRQVLFLPARSESIGCAVGRAMLHFFHLEASVKGYLTIDPPMTPVVSVGSEDPYIFGGCDLFDGIETVLPWMTLQSLRFVHAGFLLNELEASGSNCLELMGAPIDADIDGDEGPASDSDCEEEPAISFGKEDSVIVLDGVLSDGRSSGKSSTRIPNRRGKGEKRSSDFASFGSACKSIPRAFSSTCIGTDSAIAEAFVRVRKCPGEEFVLPEEAATISQLKNSLSDGTCGACKDEATDQQPPPGGAGKKLGDPSAVSHSDAHLSSCDALLNTSAMTLEHVRRMSSESGRGDCPVWAQALLRSRAQNLNKNSSARSSVHLQNPDEVDEPSSAKKRPLTRKARIHEPSRSSYSSCPRMSLPLGSASFPVYMAIDENGQVTYLSSPVSPVSDGTSALPRLHISGLHSPASVSTRSGTTRFVEPFDSLSSTKTFRHLVQSVAPNSDGKGFSSLKERSAAFGDIMPRRQLRSLSRTRKNTNDEVGNRMKSGLWTQWISK